MIVRWTRRALGDVRRIARHIAGDYPLAAVEFAVAVQNRAARLQPFPLGRIGAFEDTREMVVHHNNYILACRVRGAEVALL